MTDMRNSTSVAVLSVFIAVIKHYVRLTGALGFSFDRFILQHSDGDTFIFNELICWPLHG